jgi:glutamine synthetase
MSFSDGMLMIPHTTTSAYTGWHTGYPDAPVRLDISTFRKIPWENDLPFFLGELLNEKKEPSDICPRQLVKKLSKERE